MVFRYTLAGIMFPFLLIDKAVVFMHTLLYKELIVNEILWLYYIYVTNNIFLGKLCNLLLLMHLPMKESGIRSIFKDVIDAA